MIDINNDTMFFFPEMTSSSLKFSQDANKNEVEKLLLQKMSIKTVANSIIGKLLSYAKAGNSYDSVGELRMQGDSFWLEDIKLSNNDLANVKFALGSGRLSDVPSGSLDAPPSGHR